MPSQKNRTLNKSLTPQITLPARVVTPYIEGLQISAPNGQQTKYYDKRGRPIWFFKSNGQAVCGSPKQGKPKDVLCLSGKRLENGRCELHGGGAPVGSANPNTKDGNKADSNVRRYAGFNAVLSAGFTEMMADATLLELAPDVSAVDLRIRQLSAQVENQNPTVHLKRISEAYDKLEMAAVAGSKSGVAAARNELELAIRGGAKDSETWAEIFRLQEHRRKLVDTENKRKAQSASLMPLSALKDYTRSLVEITRTSVIEKMNQAADATLEDIRAALTQGRYDAPTVNAVLSVVAPHIQARFHNTSGGILERVADRIGELIGASQVKPAALNEGQI